MADHDDGELAGFRQAKDAFFRDGHDSPLTADQQRAFADLPYFNENPSLRVVVEPVPFDQPEDVELDLSTGEAAVYRRWARVRFEVEGAPAELTVFRDADGGEIFLPFKDATAAAGETYGAGRYLDVHEASDGRLLLNFNYAYNPYCAYNERWSCPLTPAENVLTVSIGAGEKRPIPQAADRRRGPLPARLRA